MAGGVAWLLQKGNGGCPKRYNKDKQAMNRREFLHTGCALAGVVLGVSPAVAQITSLNAAINQSGRQRMLSQRLAKAYLQIGQGIDTMRSKRVMLESMSLFETQLVELKAFAPSPENKAVFSDMDKTWRGFKSVLTAQVPNPRDARSVMAVSDDVLVLAQSATVQLEKMSGTAAARLVNLAGRQRMLSQRMAKFYQALNWGAAPGDALLTLGKARDEFVAALAELSASPKNTTAITQEIEIARLQWYFFNQALIVKPGDATDVRRFAENVATTSERILEVMDKLTGLYQQLA
jgi:hypothetical protein